MKRNTSGRSELLPFLKGETHEGVDWTQKVETTELQISSRIKKETVVQQSQYELSGLDGDYHEPIILVDDSCRYTFRNIIYTSRDEAIAKELEVEQL